MAAERKEAYHAALSSLNSAFAAWTQRQLSERPQVAWQADVRQYLAHLSALRDEFRDVVEALAAAPAPAAPPPAPPAAAPAPAASIFLPPAALAPPSAAAPAPLFTFGSAGGFGGAPAAPAAANPFASSFVSPFASPFAPAGGAAAAAAAGDEDGEDEPERPPSPSLVRASDEEDGMQTLHEVKSKMSFKVNGEWASRGTGLLQLRRPTAGGSARLVMRNETGKLWLNANLYTGLKTVQNGKAVILSLHNAVEEGAAPEKVMIMFRVKTDADAAKLKQSIDSAI